MPVITIGSGPTMVTLPKTLEWRERSSSTIPNYRVPARTTPLSDPRVFIRTPRIIEINTRFTADEKQKMFTLRDQYSWQELKIDGNLVDWVWIEEINPEYHGVEFFKAPWRTTITLTCSAT